MMTSQAQFKHHPICLRDVRVIELYIRGNIHPDEINEEQAARNSSINVGHSEYDTANHRIVVGLTLELKEGEEKESELPYFLKVELAALFEVDESKFDKEHIYDWARRNAPFILFPYLREEAYALTIRAGYKPLILPLLEVPTFQSERMAPTAEL